MNQKEWTKVIGYFIPILALAIGNLFQIDDIKNLEGMITAIVTAILTVVFGIIGLVGVVKSHDKKEKK